MPPDQGPGPEGPGTVHRTYRIPEELRAAVTARRTALGQTVRAFVAEAVAGELPALVEALAALGLSRPAAAALRPIRLPLSPGLLDALREAADRSGVPAGHLLRACLARSAGRRRHRRVGGPASDRVAGARSPEGGGRA